VELRHGSGAFIRESAGTRARLIQQAQGAVQSMVERLLALGVTADEIRRVFENEMAQAGTEQRLKGAAESQ